MIYVLLLLIVCGYSNAGKNVCRFPQRWKTYVFIRVFFFHTFEYFSVLFILFSNYDFDYKKRPSEWATTNSKTDYYKLVLSWSPTFCKQLPTTLRNRTFQCQHSDFDVVV